MKIDINHIAKLSRLRMSEEETPKFERQMNDILAMVANLPALDDPRMGLDPQNPMQLRPDEIKPSMPRGEVLKNAPQTEAGCIVVPRVVE